MPSEKIPAPHNRKRQLCTEAGPTTDTSPPPTAKRRKLDNHRIHRTPSSFWDNLSRQWLTPRALREFDRRTVLPDTPVPPDQTPKKKVHTAQLKRFARHGGPRLDNLRTYPEAGIANPSCQMMSSNHSSSRKRAKTGRESDTSSKTRRTSAYDLGFEQHLIDHGFYPEGFGGLKNLKEPDNSGEIQVRLRIPRASLSPSRFSRNEFWDFKEKNQDAMTENAIMSKAFPVITGTPDISSQENLAFGNLQDLTDGSLAKAKPDLYDGARPADLNKQVRSSLGPYVVPSKNTTAPCVPNFFAEGKGPNGSSAVAKLQVLYDGALGARGIHELRSYIHGETLFDNNTYTISSTYHGDTGDLTIYSSHPTPSDDPRQPIEYRMTQLGGWKMTGDPETFRQGATALRNAREWAQEKRKELIAAANSKALNMESSEPDSSTHSFLSPSTNEILHLDSDTSTDELALDSTTPASSIHRTQDVARKNPPPNASSFRRTTESLKRILEDPRDESS